MDTKKQPPQSHIPIKTLRTGGIQNPQQTNHFGFVPPSRHLSVSDTPSKSSPTSSSSAASSTGGGLTSFRSFRNLLPFGSAKHHHTSNLGLTTGPTRSSFASLSALRKSIHGERSVSAPQLRPEKSHDDFPVLTIELSHHLNEPLLNQDELKKNGLGLYTSQSPETAEARHDLEQPSPPHSAPASSTTFDTPGTSSADTLFFLLLILVMTWPHFLNFDNGIELVVAPPHPGPTTLGVSDLSTILESETSGLSKHLPALEDSRDLSRPPTSIDAHDVLPPSHHSYNPNQSFTPHNNHDQEQGWQRPPSPQDTSALDLSTSKVTSEVLAALAGSTARQEGWLHGVVVDDVDEDPLRTSKPKPEDTCNTSFSLGPLDPDLAALLSPNRINHSTPGEEPSTLVVMDTLSPQPLTPPLTESRRASPLPSPHLSAKPLSSTNMSSMGPSPQLTARNLVGQSTPVRRSTSLSRSTGTRFAPVGSGGVIRMARSVSDRPNAIKSHLASQSTTLSPSSLSRPLPSDGNDIDHRGITTTATSAATSSSGTASMTPSLRRRGFSPAESHLPRRPNTADSTQLPPTTTFARLTTPSRPSGSHTSSPPSSISRPLRSGAFGVHSSSNSPSAWESESVSPSSRAPSSIGTASSRLYNGRPSLDGGSDRVSWRGHTHNHTNSPPPPSSAFSNRHRDRSRSASVSENSPSSTSSYQQNGYHHHHHLTNSNTPSSSGVNVNGRPPVMEWLGPRTAKAFAAAGLIDLDSPSNHQPNRELGGSVTPSTSISRPGSRFSLARSQTSERERETMMTRSPYAPSSRLAFSEAGSSVSWGRRSESISRGTGGGGGGGGPLSDGGFGGVLGGGDKGGGGGNGTLTESASTPRTTFSVSGASTAPTTVSCSATTTSSIQHHLQNEIASLQEKHSLETGALLSALADSQRTTRVLREENVELRERLGEVEGRLGEALDEIKSLQEMMSPNPLYRTSSPVHAHTISSTTPAGSHVRSGYNRYGGREAPSWKRGVPGNGGGGGKGMQNGMSSGLINALTPEVDIRVDDDLSSSPGRLQSHLLLPNGFNHPHQQLLLREAITPPPRTRSSMGDDDERRTSMGSSRRGSLSSVAHSTTHSSSAHGTTQSHLTTRPGSSGTDKRRYSSSSSVFHIPPNSMTMLLQEESISPILSSSGPASLSDKGFSSNASDARMGGESPTLIMSTMLPWTRVSDGSLSGGISARSSNISIGMGGGGHQRTPSSNAGNISPTTASFSMMTGSPGSLHLRPEHERLLGDMPTLDLCAEDYEGSFEDEGG